MDEISENILNEELNKLLLVKIQFRENYTRLSTTWRSKIWNEEIQNTHCLSHSESLSLKDHSCWKIFIGQIKFNVREHKCVAEWRWRIVFIRNAMQEVAEKLKNENTLLSGRKYWEAMKIGRISYTAWSGITNSESILLRSWLTKQLWRTYVPHQALITSSSRKPSREVGMPRSTRDNMSIPGNVFHRQWDPDDLHDYSRNLETPSGIADDVEDSEKRGNWE